MAQTYIRIYLTTMDTYDLECGKIWGTKYKPDKKGSRASTLTTSAGSSLKTTGLALSSTERVPHMMMEAKYSTSMVPAETTSSPANQRYDQYPHAIEDVSEGLTQRHADT